MLIVAFSLAINFGVSSPYEKHYYYVDILERVQVVAKIGDKFARVTCASSL